MNPGRIPIYDQRCRSCGARLYDCGLDYEDQAHEGPDGSLYCSGLCAVESLPPTVLYPHLSGMMAREAV
jgi:hypothetical protein